MRQPFAGKLLHRLAMRPRAAFVLAFVSALAACGPDWSEYRSEAGNYAVWFPGGPPIEREHKDGAATVHVVHVARGNTTAYAVSWFDIGAPQKPAADLLLDVEARVLARLKAGPAETSQIQLGAGPGAGAPGRAFRARTADGLDIAVRIYAVGDAPMRVYQLTAAVADLSRARSEVRKFVDSFTLLK